MTEIEEKLLSKYFGSAYSEAIQIYGGYENISDDGKKYVYNSFGFKCYVLKYYWNELFYEPIIEVVLKCLEKIINKTLNFINLIRIHK
jgi:hypothetical protein